MREKAPAAEVVVVSGERDRREKVAVENRKRRETVLVREVWWSRTETEEEGGNGERREKASVVSDMQSEIIASGGREKAAAREVRWSRAEKKEEGGSGMRREKVAAEGKVEWESGKRREKAREKGKAKGEETLSEKDPTVGMNGGRVWVKKVLLAVVDPTDGIECKFADFSLREKNGGGGRRENRKDETMRNFDKKRGEGKGVGKNMGGDDPKAEIGSKIGDVKENVEGDRTVEIKRRSGNRKGGNAEKNSLGGRFRGLGKNIGHKALDSSLVWVRKEDKSEVCVAGNCSEGVLAKAGESEKKPGRGRP